MNRIEYFGIFLFFIFGFFTNAQTMVWTGASNNDFFNEANWLDSATNNVPIDGTINPGIDINLVLQINTYTSTISARGLISLGSGSLAIGSAKLNAESFSGGNVSVNEQGYVDLSGTNPFQNNIQINFTSGIGWIRTLNSSAKNVSIANLGQIKVNGNASVYKINLRLDNYYLIGCVIRANLAYTAPLMIYDATNLQGESSSIPVNAIHSGSAISGSMNNKTESFILRKGFMVTFATENDGTGKSKNYIASEADLVINALPRAVRNSISFIRVLPWNWVSKKGRTDVGTDLNTTWRYKWNNTESSSIETEFAPMAWGGGGADDATDIALYVGKYNSNHVMGFNEADNCNGQSGQYGTPKLCVVDEAVRLYKNLMKTGMRLVSPNCTEGAATGWLKEFYKKATAQDIRIDVIGVHWYDWGGSPSNTADANATQVFNRFKSYLTNVHNLYGLPIWISEFNANPYRSTATNLAFMKLALPYLETLDYVERYNWFQPNPTPLDPNDNAYIPGTGEFYTTRPSGVGAILTEVGNTYRNQISTPSIPEATVDANNNLSLVEYPNVVLNKITSANSSYAQAYDASKAVDGDVNSGASQWIVNLGITTDLNYFPLPAWLEVDLQGSYTIDSFRITEFSKAVKNFSFEVWDSTLKLGLGGWSSVISETNNPATSLITYKTFAPVTTTKVRLYVTEHNSSTLMRLFELEVYGYLSETLTIKQYEKQPFSIYPNPVKKEVLNIVGNQEIESVEVFDIAGVKMNTIFEKGKLSVTNLSTGVYYVIINNKKTVKFIKN